jgi:carbonic anhydrase
MVSRRDVIKGLVATGAGLLITACDRTPAKKPHAKKGVHAAKEAQAGHGHDAAKIVAPKDAIALLEKGNERYVTMQRLSDPGVGPAARKPLTEGQWPYATILCCSDSRVPPEIVFDEGLGRLFIVRVAGNMITPELLGSIEYASLHSTSRLVVVLGHESCGAVGAAVHFAENPGTKETPGINDIVNRLMPAVMKAQKDTKFLGKELVEAAAKENVRMNVEQIAFQSEALEEMQKKGELMIVGGYYSLETGKVEIWA